MKEILMLKHIPPTPMSANDKRVKLNNSTIPVDFRIIAEDEYQLLLSYYNDVTLKHKRAQCATNHIDQVTKLPIPNTIWTHTKSGNTYIVLDVCTLESDLSTVVIYTREYPDDKPLSDAKWVRPVDKFLDGRFTPFSAATSNA